MVRTDWQLKLERLLAELEGADATGFPALARELHKVLCSAPPKVDAVLGSPCSSARLEGLLNAGAMREAAFELLGRAQYMLSRGSQDQVIATVAAEGLFSETTRSARDESTAFAGALALGLRAFGLTATMSSPSHVSH